MKRNRIRSNRYSVVAGRTMQIAAVMLMGFVVVIVNMLAQSSCKQLNKSIAEKKVRLDRLEEEKTRESTKWNEMKTEEKLEQALLRHGLAMKYPKAEQTVRMGDDGRPEKGQLALRRAALRGRTAVAAVSTSSAPRRPRAAARPQPPVKRTRR